MLDLDFNQYFFIDPSVLKVNKLQVTIKMDQREQTKLVRDFGPNVGREN